MDCGAVFPSVPCLSQVHRKGDFGDEADGMKGDRRLAGRRRWLHRETRGVCVVVVSVTTRQFQCGCWAETATLGHREVVERCRCAHGAHSCFVCATRQSPNQTRVHFQTVHRIGLQKVRPTKEPPGGQLRPDQEREKIVRIHSYSGGNGG